VIERVDKFWNLGRIITIKDVATRINSTRFVFWSAQRHFYSFSKLSRNLRSHQRYQINVVTASQKISTRNLSHQRAWICNLNVNSTRFSRFIRGFHVLFAVFTTHSWFIRVVRVLFAVFMFYLWFLRFIRGSFAVFTFCLWFLRLIRDIFSVFAFYLRLLRFIHGLFAGFTFFRGFHVFIAFYSRFIFSFAFN
jgi:hypothetical protein